MKFHKNQDENKSNKVGNALASTPETNNSGKKREFTFEELLKGSYISHFTKLSDGSSKPIWKQMNWEKKEPFMSFDEAMEWLVKHNQDNWDNVKEAWTVFHSGCGYPKHILEKYCHFYQVDSWIKTQFVTSNEGLIVALKGTSWKL